MVTSLRMSRTHDIQELGNQSSSVYYFLSCRWLGVRALARPELGGLLSRVRLFENNVLWCYPPPRTPTFNSIIFIHESPNRLSRKSEKRRFSIFSRTRWPIGELTPQTTRDYLLVRTQRPKSHRPNRSCQSGDIMAN